MLLRLIAMPFVKVVTWGSQTFTISVGIEFLKGMRDWRIIKSLKQNFWEDIKSWIYENIKKTEINWLEKINSKIWNYFLSSCFHPDEFWIWSYRPTSLINILEIRFY